MRFRSIYSVYLLVGLWLLISIGIGNAESPFSTRKNLVKPLGPGAEAALKKIAEDTAPIKINSLTKYMDGVVEKIDKTVKLEASEADKLKLVAKDLIDTTTKEWQPRLVANLRPRLPLTASDAVRVGILRKWKPRQFVPQYTVTGWLPPDRRPAWEAAVKSVLGEERNAQWIREIEATRADLNEKTKEFLKEWATKGRQPMDQTLGNQTYQMTQVLKLPAAKAKELEKLASKLVDDHVAAELIAGAELMDSLVDQQRPKNFNMNLMGRQFVRPTDKELIDKWETVAAKFLGEASITAWRNYYKKNKAAELLSKLPPNKLRWNNNDSIPGYIDSATADGVSWQAPFFTEPIPVRWNALRRIDIPVASTAVSGAFSFALRDGSHICGDIEEVTSDSISINSKRHGKAVLKRAEVLSARRRHGGGLVYSGPSGESEWRLLKDRLIPEMPVLAGIIPILTVDGGAMQLPYWNRNVFLKANIPDDRVDVTFRISSKSRPEFKLSIEIEKKAQLRIETWDDEIVLTCGSDKFKLVKKLAEEDREVALRLCWDIKAKKCSLYTTYGEHLLDWEVPNGPSAGGTGIMLMNKGRDLTLKQLRVSEWDGQPLVPTVDPDNPRVELVDGSVLTASVTDSTEDGVSIGEEKFPLSQIEAMIFSTDEPSTELPDMRVTWSDGTLVKGKIVAIKNKIMTMQTSFTQAPFDIQIDSLRQIFINMPLQPETPGDQLDKIQFSKSSLRGKFITTNEATPRWLVIGSDKPVAIPPEVHAKISRAFAKDTEQPVVPALLYTRYGDVVPGDMSSIDKGSVELRSAIIGKEKFVGKEVRAVQFNAKARLNITSFEDPGWSIVKGNPKTVKREKGTLKLEPSTLFGHNGMALASEVSFTMEGTSYGGMRVRFFSNGADLSKSTNYLFANYGREIYSGLETSEGQLGEYERTPVENGKPVRIKFLIKEKEIEFKIQGITVSKFNIESAKKEGSGLYLEPASLWGNQVRAITLSKFYASSPPGRTSLPDINEETKTQALTIPRFRRDDPPCHMLIGSNGDVLRGEIEAATTKNYGFRFGMENLTVPRDRVKAVVWLQEPLPDEAAIEKTAAQKALEVKLSQNMNYARTTLHSITRAIQREVPDLKLKLPAKKDQRRFTMIFAEKSVEQALNEVAGLFGLRSRVKKDGTFILEQKPTLAHDMEPKYFWLATEAFTQDDEVKEMLTTKGVFFPGNASVSYDADAMMLRSINTKENNEKVEQVLQSAFGGVLGSPSHWLLLASGGRLALDVEKFGEEHIIGSNPRLGECKVPIGDVFAISNTAPEPDPVLVTVSNWHTINAPEPVLPDGDSNTSSDLIGKDVADFKLPLLSGGNFELSKQKGKVVVLDFWATWCGPCIRLLPDLITEMAAFPSDHVSFIGINQAENNDHVKRFLDTRGWKMNVAMDTQHKVEQQFGVDGIPHTVVIGRDGKVVWEHSGYTPEAAKQAAAAVKKALEVESD